MKLLIILKCSFFISGKILPIELWLKNLPTDQNAGLFSLQYLRHDSKYELEFLHVFRAIARST